MTTDFQKRFEELIHFIDESIAEVRGGKMVAMDSLESIVANLCKDIEKADPEIAKNTQPQMAQMITKLDELAQALMEYQISKQGGD